MRTTTFSLLSLILITCKPTQVATSYVDQNDAYVGRIEIPVSILNSQEFNESVLGRDLDRYYRIAKDNISGYDKKVNLRLANHGISGFNYDEDSILLKHYVHVVVDAQFKLGLFDSRTNRNIKAEFETRFFIEEGKVVSVSSMVNDRLRVYFGPYDFPIRRLVSFDDTAYYFDLNEKLKEQDFQVPDEWNFFNSFSYGYPTVDSFQSSPKLTVKSKGILQVNPEQNNSETQLSINGPSADFESATLVSKLPFVGRVSKNSLMDTTWINAAGEYKLKLSNPQVRVRGDQLLLQYQLNSSKVIGNIAFISSIVTADDNVILTWDFFDGSEDKFQLNELQLSQLNNLINEQVGTRVSFESENVNSRFSKEDYSGILNNDEDYLFLFNINGELDLSQ